MEPMGIMQVTDTLDAGGLEHMAVNVANGLVSVPYRSHLCVTRRLGALESKVLDDVEVFSLGRSGRFDLRAVLCLVSYIRKNRIHVLHAHGTSLFLASAAALLERSVKLVWHDHFGRLGIEERNSTLYRLATRRAEGIISVTEPLAYWARDTLRHPPNRVWYLSNFAAGQEGQSSAFCDLPGTRGSRIVCVANFRPEKNHMNLLHAFARVIPRAPDAHLLLVGAANDSACFNQVEQFVRESNLSPNVTCLGARTDVHTILRNCDIGVLSSASEGLPLALIEYGMAGLPVVATNVGQCSEVVDQGRAGLLVPSASVETLAHALLLLLRSAKIRKELANNFACRVAQHYSADSAIKKICEIYETVMEPKKVGLP